MYVQQDVEVAPKHGDGLLNAGTSYVAVYQVYHIVWQNVHIVLTVLCTGTCTAPEACRYEAWWVPNRGHNDVLFNNETEFIR